jgi:hypothetical protein
MSTTKKPVNYLNNKDILKEIHDSKTSYCSFTRGEYNRYDLIIDTPQDSLEKSLAQITKTANIKQAKENRAARLTIETGKPVEPKDIDDTDLVFRVMTWDHIPVSPKQPRKVVQKKTAKDIIEFLDDDDSVFEDLEDPSTKDEVDDMVHTSRRFSTTRLIALDQQFAWVRVIGRAV